MGIHPIELEKERPKGRGNRVSKDAGLDKIRPVSGIESGSTWLMEVRPEVGQVF